MIKKLQILFVLIFLFSNLRSQMINGPDSVCAFDNNISYGITPAPFATSYQWDLPPGATFTGASNTNNISVNFDGISDSICVTPDFSGTPGNKICKYIFVDILNASINGDTLICGSEIAGINAIANGGVKPFSYMWSNGNSNQGQFVTPFADQNFTVTITDGIGCTDQASHFIKVNSSVTLVAGNDESILPGASAILSASGANDYVWSPAASLSCSQCQFPTAFPTQTTTYYVTTSNANECTNADSMTIFVEIFDNILIPNLFTPNADGLNDIWYVQGVDINNIKIILFNRWGQEVYNSTDINEGWNGMIEGTQAPVGVYAYFIEYSIIGQNFNILKSGDLSLIR